MRCLVIFLVLWPFSGNAQSNIWCLRAEKFYASDNEELKERNKPICACYTENVFAFSSPYTDTFSFDIEPHTKFGKKTENGNVETFTNEENDVMMRGEYSVYIVYGTPKKISINLTRVPGGPAYFIESPHFLGDKETQEEIVKIIKKKLE